MSTSVRGPIKLSPNQHYFVDQQGTPFFWLGDTAWPLVGKYTKDEAEAYLRCRAKQGFTIIQCVIAIPEIADGPIPRPNYAGHLPWIDGDPARPHEAFFQHLDYLIQLADDLGLVLAMLPAWAHFVIISKVINRDNARAYGEWLGERYRNALNVIWITGGDRVPSGFEEVFRQLGGGLRLGSCGRHLITYHPCGSRSSSDYFHNEPWLDFNMLQTWCDWHHVHAAILADYVRLPIKPTILGEGAYENGPEYPTGPITPLIIRRQAWWSFLAGGFHTYGQDQMWRMDPGWDQTLETPGAAHVSRFKSIIDNWPWWKLIPDQSIFASGVSSEHTLNAAARSADDDWVVVYLSSPCTVSIKLYKVATPAVKASWIDPKTSQIIEVGEFLTGNSLDGTFLENRSQLFTVPPGWEDAVLRLEAVEGPTNGLGQGDGHG